IQVGAAREDVGVTVDQSGEHGRVAQVEYLGARRDVHFTRWPYLHDARAFDQNDLLLGESVRLPVKHASGANRYSLMHSGLWRRKRRRRRGFRLLFLWRQGTEREAVSQNYQRTDVSHFSRQTMSVARPRPPILH